MEAIERIQTRVQVAAADSPTAYFFELLFMGELVMKLLVAGMISGVLDDRERHRYRLEHQLVRTSGLGEWTSALEDVVHGPASQSLTPAAQPDQLLLAERLKRDDGEWRTKAVSRLHAACTIIDHNYPVLPQRVALKQWLHDFTWLRNKTRGHGAPTPKKCEGAAEALAASIHMLVRELPILSQRSWAYLHRNLSGKYRISRISGSCKEFDSLKQGMSFNFVDGVYVFWDGPSFVSLVKSEPGLSDFYVANGSFTDTKFELISFATDDRIHADASPFRVPPTTLPKSETEGVGRLQEHGACFTNLPPQLEDYVARPSLEAELREVLIDERHPVITLVGRGGTGKTSLTLSVLHDMADTGRFFTIIWFSARDIDLLPYGPKVVRPQVLSESDVANEYVNLVGKPPAELMRATPHQRLTAALAGRELSPTLFVLDNFETIRNPLDVYRWLDASVRLPNKILITTRNRDFKGDYPVEVGGMTELEFEKLVDVTARRLKIADLLRPEYLETVFKESDGHPYVVKVLLGEVANAKRLVRVERIAGGRDDILEALFERSYVHLPPVAQRVFLTLCNWRSAVSSLGLEAVLLRPENEKMDVPGAIETLRRASLVEVHTSSTDNESFLTVPLTASVFGRRKLAVSPVKSAIDADTRIIRMMGAMQESEIERGVSPRIERMFREVALACQADSAVLRSFLPVLEYLASRHPKSWLMVADLVEEVRPRKWVEQASRAVARYLEQHPEDWLAWHRLAALSEQSGDILGQVNALVQGSLQPTAAYADVSYVAGALNRILSKHSTAVPTDQKKILLHQVLEVLTTRGAEANAGDCSRIAWLYLRVGNSKAARKWVKRGLDLNPGDIHCIRLGETLGSR